MATYRTLPSGRIQARVFHNGRQSTIGTFANRTAAKKAAIAAEASIHGNTYLSPSKQTLADFVDQWLKAVAMNRKPTTLGFYTEKTRYAVRGIGGIRIDRIDGVMLDRLYVDLLARGGRAGQPLSALTVTHVHRVLHNAFKYAVRKGMLTQNPCDFADPPKPNQRKPKMWSIPEVQQFLAAINPHRLSVAYLLAAFTGMRRGEIAGLRWSAVDLDQGQLAVTGNRVMAGTAIESTPKTKGSQRTIALDPTTVKSLRAHRLQQQTERLAAPVWYDSDYVFVRSDGTPINPQYLYVLMQRTAQRAGLDPIPFHGLRHSYATAALQAQLDVRLVAELLGHESTRTTQETYQHVLPDIARKAAHEVAALMQTS